MTNRKINYNYGARTVEYCPRWHNHDHYVHCCQGRSCFGGVEELIPKTPQERVRNVRCNWPEEAEWASCNCNSSSD